MSRPPFLLVCAALATAAACGGAAGAPSAASPGTPAPDSARLLVVTHTDGFRHDSIPAAETALAAVGAESGLYVAEFCRTAADVRTCLATARLAEVQAVFFANTTGSIGIPDMEAFLGWIRSGGAFLGAHSATDTYRDVAAFVEMIGGAFDTHGQVVEAEVRVADASHPSVAHVAPGFRITDEWYRFRDLAPGRHVLLAFDRVPPDGLGTAGEPADLPLAWHRSYGSGRVFYTALGHTREVWEDPRFRRHVREAIRWALQP